MYHQVISVMNTRIGALIPDPCLSTPYSLLPASPLPA